MQKLNGVFDRNDMADLLLINTIQQSCQSGRLA